MPVKRRMSRNPKAPAVPAVVLTEAELVALVTAPGTPLARLLDRKAIEAAVERLIDHLDALDAPSEDLEPYLTGFTNGADDREDEHDGREPDVDAEPSLGWPEDIKARLAPRALYVLDSENDDADIDDDDPGAEPWWQRNAHPDLTDGAHV